MRTRPGCLMTRVCALHTHDSAWQREGGGSTRAARVRKACRILWLCSTSLQCRAAPCECTPAVAGSRAHPWHGFGDAVASVHASKGSRAHAGIVKVTQKLHIRAAKRGLWKFFGLSRASVFSLLPSPQLSSRGRRLEAIFRYLDDALCRMVRGPLMPHYSPRSSSYAFASPRHTVLASTLA
jgi:hypothetical protein